jgi:hypothetical protein
MPGPRHHPFAPTIRAEEIYFPSNRVRGFAGLAGRIQGESAEEVCKRGARLVDALRMRDQLSPIGEPRHGNAGLRTS